MDNYIGPRHINQFVNCPYCEIRQMITFSVGCTSCGEIDLNNSSIVVCCESNSAGCGEDYVVDASLNLTTKTRKIQ